MARQPDHEVDAVFPDRWSPRAFSSEPLTPAQVDALFEAARWALSSGNEQPWHFVYGTSDEERGELVGLLNDSNRRWAGKAPLIGFVIARRQNGKGLPNRHCAFDTGAAWMSLNLQARRLGLHAHGMAGFDLGRAYEVLGFAPETHEVMCAFVVGKHGKTEDLPEDLQAREVHSGRKPTAEIARRFKPGGG